MNFKKLLITGAASHYYAPDQAHQWRQQADERLQGMKSGSEQRFFEHIPAACASASIRTGSRQTSRFLAPSRT
jgi:hypothetical protein